MHKRISNNSAWVQGAWRLLPPARGDVRCNEVRLERAHGGHHDDPDCRYLPGDVQVQPRRLLGKHLYDFIYINLTKGNKKGLRGLGNAHWLILLAPTISCGEC